MGNLKKTLKILSIFVILIILLFNFSVIANASTSNAPVFRSNNNYNKESKAISYITMNLETQEESENVFQPSEIATFSNSTSNHTNSYIPNQYEISPSSIIGGDERALVSDPSAFPNSTVAYLEAEFPNGTVGIGTAFVWYKDLALTAGHCIYNSEWGDGQKK